MTLPMSRQYVLAWGPDSSVCSHHKARGRSVSCIRTCPCEPAHNSANFLHHQTADCPFASELKREREREVSSCDPIGDQRASPAH
eukprot:964988-Amphidinium_carterae.1